MAQSCLRCLKYTMCVANFLCFLSGIAVLGFGIYIKVHFNLGALTPTLAKFPVGNMLVVSGIIITSVSFLGFLGALRENRLLLLTFFLVLFLLMLVELTAACLLLVYERKIVGEVERELREGLKNAKNYNASSTEWDWTQTQLDCCGVTNASDWEHFVPRSCCQGNCPVPRPPYKTKGCLAEFKTLFEDNFLAIGISVIIICIIEVLGMCFAMTLFCHISRSGLGYKL